MYWLSNTQHLMKIYKAQRS